MEKRQKRNMETKRSPFQGISNIIRFNWHFYVLTFILSLLILIIGFSVAPNYNQYLGILVGLLIGISLLSLGISYYIYDYTDLYTLPWVENLDNKKVLNIHAGFDETSHILRAKYQKSQLIIADFYDPQKHSEISIKRARKIYPPAASTISVSTTSLPFCAETYDYVHIAFSAHEIRNERERIDFFKEINRVTKKTGTITVTEHLRDRNNFIAYTIGFFHFYSKSSWKKVFKKAHLNVAKELKTTPFITTFTLVPYGNTL